MIPAPLLLVAPAAGGGPTTTVPLQTTDFTVANVGGALVVAAIAAVPLGLSLWALLDAARRPRWAWALTGRRQVVWMGSILFGALLVPVGLVVSGYYLMRVRPAIIAIEDGRL